MQPYRFLQLFLSMTYPWPIETALYYHNFTAFRKPKISARDKRDRFRGGSRGRSPSHAGGAALVAAQSCGRDKRDRSRKWPYRTMMVTPAFSR